MSSRFSISNVSVADPRVLALACSVLALMIMLGGVALKSVGLLGLTPAFPWTIAGAFMLLHAVASSAGILSAPKLLQHIQYSVFSFVGVMFCLGGAAWLFSGLSLFEAPSMNVIFLILIICKMILIGVGLFVRNIYNWLAEDERLNKK